MQLNSRTKAAGGQRWHRYKSSKAVRFDIEEKRRTRYENFERQKAFDKADKFVCKKQAYKQGIADAQTGIARQSKCNEYLAGYSYGEYTKH